MEVVGTVIAVVFLVFMVIFLIAAAGIVGFLFVALLLAFPFALFAA